MRELKFRAWDGNLMHSIVPRVGATMGMLSDLADEHKWQVMQYIGMKDKNGADIYEGDVVHIDESGQPWVIEYGYFGDAAFYAANQINSGRLLESSQYCAGFTIVKDFVECEVIGNIHEHPELLQGE
jgi:uncharacterized phage protein (TIGR01671 family)